MKQIPVFMAIGGIIIAVLCGRELFLSAGASANPQKISCQELITNGAGGNRHILLTDYACPSAYVYLTTAPPGRNPKRSKGPFETVYQPVLSTKSRWYEACVRAYEAEGKDAEEPQPEPDEIKLVLKLNRVRSEDALCEITSRNLSGLLVNGVESLSSEDKRLLRDGYPGVNFSDCYILEVGRKPVDAKLLLAGLVGGIGLTIAGVLIFIWPWIQARREAATTRAALQQVGQSFGTGLEQATFSIPGAEAPTQNAQPRPKWQDDNGPIKMP